MCVFFLFLIRPNAITGCFCEPTLGRKDLSGCCRVGMRPLAVAFERANELTRISIIRLARAQSSRTLVAWRFGKSAPDAERLSSRRTELHSARSAHFSQPFSYPTSEERAEVTLAVLTKRLRQLSAVSSEIIGNRAKLYFTRSFAFSRAVCARPALSQATFSDGMVRCVIARYSRYSA